MLFENEEPEKTVILRTDDIKVSDEFNFSQFLLSDDVLKALNLCGFIKPSPIQLKGIPLAKCGLDLIIQAKSGTGKTLVFLIALLEQLDSELPFPQALIIVPTREIAVQIVSVLNQLGKFIKGFSACSFIGGTDIKEDRRKIQKLKAVVGTPGRILHLINTDVFNIKCLKTIVLDEADKLLEKDDLGKDVLKILMAVKHKLQIIATTATVTSEMQKTLKTIMKNPIGITPKHEVPVLLGIKQFVDEIEEDADNIKQMLLKIEELKRIFSQIPFKQCLLFTESHLKTSSYSNYLSKAGWQNEVINGSLEQVERLEVLSKLQKFKCRILITTDLMARGIDIENVNLIINLDLPRDCCTYLHRIGRAGRFGTYGIAITFISGEKEAEKFQKLLSDIGGNEFNVIKFPKNNIPNLWNFENEAQENEEKLFGKFNVVVQEPKVEEKSAGTEIIEKNLSLLKLSKLLVDTSLESDFDIDNIIENYENSCLRKDFNDQPHQQLDEKHEDDDDATGKDSTNSTEMDLNITKNISAINSTENLPEFESKSHHSSPETELVNGKSDNSGFENYDNVSDCYPSNKFQPAVSSPKINLNWPETHSEKVSKQQISKPKYIKASCRVNFKYQAWSNLYYNQLRSIEDYLENQKRYN